MGSVEYFARLLREDCVIDLGEHYVKRSERNRAAILSANGPMRLTVHVADGNRPQQPVRDVRIDYSKRWQHQHWVSILSAYKSSPYFDHYAEHIEPFYRREWRWLVDYDMEYTRAMLRLLGSSAEPRTSESYMEADGPRPARRTRLPRRARRRPDLRGRALRSGLFGPYAFRAEPLGARPSAVRRPLGY